MASLDFAIRKNIIPSLAVAAVAALPMPSVAQTTLLDQLIRKALPHPVAARATSGHMPGTAWLSETPNVSGIALGMSPAEVTTAMTGKPLALVTTDRLPARADRIQASVDGRLGTRRLRRTAKRPTRSPGSASAAPTIRVSS